jgi:hypothetical protein
MNQELIDIINKVKAKISDNSDMVWTHYGNAKQLTDELRLYTQELQNGNMSSLEKIKLLFLPTGTLQEHSISNGWRDEYLKLAEKFDNLYSTVTNS